MKVCAWLTSLSAACRWTEKRILKVELHWRGECGRKKYDTIKGCEGLAWTVYLESTRASGETAPQSHAKSCAFISGTRGKGRGWRSSFLLGQMFNAGQGAFWELSNDLPWKRRVLIAGKGPWDMTSSGPRFVNFYSWFVLPLVSQGVMLMNPVDRGGVQGMAADFLPLTVVHAKPHGLHQRLFLGRKRGCFWR